MVPLRVFSVNVITTVAEKLHMFSKLEKLTYTDIIFCCCCCKFHIICNHVYDDYEQSPNSKNKKYILSLT